MEDENMIICPLVDREIYPVDCMENRDVKEEYVPDEYKQKDNWKEICRKCKYFEL